MVFQKTISKEATISGIGLHTGKTATVTLVPSAPNSGFVFRRTDLEGKPEVKAVIENVTDTSRSTTIKKGEAAVITIEHLLAALVACDIDNVLVEIDNFEVPIMDGSAQPFVEIIQQAGIMEQKEEREVWNLTETVRFYDEAKNAELIAIPSDKFEVDTSIDYSSSLLGTQHAELKGIENFNQEIASARTFCFLHEIQGLLERNLIKGGNLENAIVFADRRMSGDELQKLSTHFSDIDIEIKEEGVLNNTELRYRNEAARHKLLDVVGDTSLLGIRINAKIIATRPGHSSNVEFTRILKQKYLEANKKSKAPQVDIYGPPVEDITGIEKTLPHRYPFLLVDKILKISPEEVVGMKMVTFNEHYFVGHFPGAPVMPGVLQLEAMAQTGGILLLKTVPDPENYLTYFLKIDNAKFRKTVVPGDVLLFHLKLTRPIRRGICEMQAEAYVGDNLVAEAVLTAKIQKKTT